MLKRLLLVLLLASCSDYDLVPIPDLPEQPIEEEPKEEGYEDVPIGENDNLGKEDVLIVLDTSGSMSDDQHVFKQIAELPYLLDDRANRWQMTIIVADPRFEYAYYLDESSEDISYSRTLEVVEWFFKKGGQGERGLDSAIAFMRAHPNYWLSNSNRTLIFVSDEPDQSEIHYEDFLLTWNIPNTEFVSVTGIDPETRPADYGWPCNPMVGQGYLEIADNVIDICLLDDWQIL